MDLKVLADIGLTSGEARVYVALLELGRSTAGPVMKKSGVSPSKIYNVLDRLSGKGLVSYMLEGKTKSFRAMQPSQLLDFVEESKEALTQKETALKNFLPQLEALHQPSEYRAEIFEGVRGIKRFFDMSLEIPKRADEICVIGYPKIASRIFNAYFREFHKRRQKLGIRGRVVYDYETWFWKKREPRKLLGQRYLPKGIRTPAFIYIFCDYVGTIIITEKQKICFLIKNQEVADSYMQYFELMWAGAREPKK